MRSVSFALLTTVAVLSLASRVVHAQEEFSPPDRGFTIGGQIGGYLFSGENEIGQRDPDTADTLEPALAIGLRLAYAVNWMISVEGEAEVLPTSGEATGTSLPLTAWRAHALVHFLTGRLQPFAVGGIGILYLNEAKDLFEEDVDPVIHAGVGGRYWIGDSWGARADLRVLFPPTLDHELGADWEATVGLFKTFEFGAKEAQETGPTDTDGDGVMDDVDQCIQEPEDIDGFEDQDGCPDSDNDRDGITDANDRCPLDPEDMNGIEDEDGCPEKDDDGDGVIGAADQCPTEAEDKDGFQDEDGCPDADNDGDGIADASDECPAEPETVNQFEDEDGCPDEVPEEVAKFTGTIKGIRFDLGKATIRPVSFRVLDEAVAVLEKYPEVKLEIQGHTDTTGSLERNRTLSQERAQAVMDYLVSKGIDAGRLTANGYGPDQPIADNGTSAGRAENRRVDFVRQ